MKKKYTCPLVETLQVEYDKGVMDFGSVNAPGQGFDNSNTNDYDTDF